MRLTYPQRRNLSAYSRISIAPSLSNGAEHNRGNTRTASHRPPVGRLLPRGHYALAPPPPTGTAATSSRAIAPRERFVPDAGVVATRSRTLSGV